MIGTLLTDNKGAIISPASLYNPSEGVVNFTRKVSQDYGVGYNIQNRGFKQFDNRSPLQEMAQNQELFNNYVASESPDPEDAWKYKGRRPIGRNKIMGIAAQATASLMVPHVFAQNDQDDEDKDASQVMRDLIQYHIENSDYDTTMLFGVISGLVNPAVYLNCEFANITTEIKEKNSSGKITKKEVVDDVLSGFQANIVPFDEMMITNVYEFDVQRQRALIRKKYIDFDEAEARYGKHENFKYVRPGVKVFYSDSQNAFYETFDQNISTLVEEVTYYNRREDVEVCFLNGIYMGTSDVESNMMRHRDYENRPKYPFAKSGYHPIDEKRFHYFKSGANVLFQDDKLLNAMSRARMDMSLLAGVPPIGISGEGTLTSKVMIPGTSFMMPPNTTFTPLNNGSNLGALDTAIQMTERSMIESSQDDIRSGIGSPQSRTAFETAQIEQNAKVQLGIFGKMVARLVKDFGYLMMDDIIQHQTVASTDSLISKDKLKYPTFLLPKNKGRKNSSKIRFTSPADYESTDEEQKQYELLDEEGGMDSDMRIYEVNPEAFRNLTFKLYVEADEFLPKNDLLEKALALEGYREMVQNPHLDQKQVAQDLVSIFKKGEVDKYILKQEPMNPQMGEQGASPVASGPLASSALQSPLVAK